MLRGDCFCRWLGLDRGIQPLVSTEVQLLGNVTAAKDAVDTRNAWLRTKKTSTRAVTYALLCRLSCSNHAGFYALYCIWMRLSMPPVSEVYSPASVTK